MEAQDRLSAPMPTLQEDLSESDAEPLSEAIRDARVAYVKPSILSSYSHSEIFSDLRPTNIAIQVLSDGDQDFTSGDESDEHDSTDYSTDYDDMFDGMFRDLYGFSWFIFHTDELVEAPWFSLNQYSGYCRHYDGNFISRPSRWAFSPFTRTLVSSSFY